MSILGKIFDRILPGRRKFEEAGAQLTAPTPLPQGTGAQPASPSAPQTMGAGAATAERVDIEPVLDQLAATKGQKLNWRTSIVDLMKLVDLDSSLQERKELAKELKYTGDMDDSAAMNVWLHKQVMKKLEENGGKVPADLKD